MLACAGRVLLCRALLDYIYAGWDCTLSSPGSSSRLSPFECSGSRYTVHTAVLDLHKQSDSFGVMPPAVCLSVPARRDTALWLCQCPAVLYGLIHGVAPQVCNCLGTTLDCRFS